MDKLVWIYFNYKVNICLDNYYNKNILFNDDSVDPLKYIMKFFTNDNDKNNTKFYKFNKITIFI